MLLALILSLLPVAAAARDRSEAPAISSIERMATAIDAAIEAADRHGPERVLVVFDIDSTLLFDPRGGPRTGIDKAAEPERFRAAERAVMYLKSLEPTEPALRAELARLAERGIATHALTARGADMRGMTERELGRHGLAFPLAPDCGPPLCLKRGILPPAMVHNAAREALGEAELARLGFARGRSVSVSDGIMFASGLDKGVMLRTLLASLGRRFATVVFVDDAPKNVRAVSDAARAMEEQALIFHYAPPPSKPPLSQEERDGRWAKAMEAICAALEPAWCDHVAGP